MNITAWKMDYLAHTGLSCTAPCSMYSVLLEHGLIQDPFYGTNELESTKLSENDCTFYTEFTVESDTLQKDYVELEFYGLDTVCDIHLNGKFLAHTENMHRKFAFDVKSLLQMGSNKLELFFKSPIRFFQEKDNRHHLENNRENMPGSSHMRKALYMTGWDWGPRLPDMGIFRKVSLAAYDVDKIGHTVIRQAHKADAVDLTFDISTLKNSGCDVFVQIDGQKVKIENDHTVVTVKNPKLWWVRGYGEQNLYDITFTLERDGKIIDTVAKRIGLRTLTVSTKAVKDGNEFCFVNNGVKIFAMGANMIPEDSLYARITNKTTKQRIQDCLFANFNCIRIWGGGYYPEEEFYDLCDEAGLLVWQDFMVACASIYLSRENEENMVAEAIYNFSRISHHACLGILCGNNEMEMAVAEWEGFNDGLAQQDYLRLYERLLPDICAKYAPDVFYWPSSPSSGGGFADTHKDNKGDVHCWSVWHGCSPFEEYREHKFRFCSEYGFESFPCMKTINSFSRKEDQNAFSPVMENHQKNDAGNRKILMYLADRYLYPENFEDFVYISQLLQAEAVKTGAEHFRRIRGYCMGSLYWQLNDCWPVVSWSSVDYYGRYKPLHYAARRFYAPVAHCIVKEDGRITVNVANETMEDQKIRLRWGVCKNDNTLICGGTEVETVKKLSSKDVLELCLEELSVDPRETYFYADLLDENGQLLMRQTELLALPKAFCWLQPEISVSGKNLEGGVELSFTAKYFAKDIVVDFKTEDWILSDNYFSLIGGEPYKIFVQTDWDADALLADMQIKCVNNINR